jgi:2-dehydropantoate 2-reductase
LSEYRELAGPVLVVGVGAIGGTTAGGLLRAGRDVTLIDPWYQNVEAIRRRGLRVTVDGAILDLDARALYPDELCRLQQQAQVVLLACKSYETETVVRGLEPYLEPDGVVVSLQNGINEDLIASVVGCRRTVGAVVHYGAAMFEAAHAVRYSPSSWQSYTVGELDGSEGQRIEAVASLLSEAGRTSVTVDIFGALWAKLTLNCMTNGLTAVTDMSTPAVWDSDAGQALMVRLASEAATVARAQGREIRPLRLVAADTELPPELLVSAGTNPAADSEMRTLLKQEAAARLVASTGGPEVASSMLQDIRKHRRSEIEYLNGYVVREGARLGVATPVNAAVCELLHAVAVGDEQQDPAHLDRLVDALPAQTFR